jgi:hypothetical protein
MVHATKIKEVKVFEIYPLQSDYLNVWLKKSDQDPEISSKKNMFRSLINVLPISFKNKIRGIRQLYKCSLHHDNEFYKRW